FTGQGITREGLSCGGSDATALSCTGFLASDVDGTLLDVGVQVPQGPGPHPLVVLLHGWAGSKGSSGDIADRLLGAGYAVLRYSARGFGDSWGQVNLVDRHVEIRDLRSMVAQVVDQGRLRLDADAVAITGASYGGGHSWLATLEPTFPTPGGDMVRIRTVVPIVGWSDLLQSLVPNGRSRFSVEPLGGVKTSWVNALFVSGLRDDPARPYPNYPEYLVRWESWINTVEPTPADPVWSEIRDGLAGYRSIWWQRDFWTEAASHRTPIFVIQGWTDDLFPPPEAIRMVLALRTVDPGYPVKAYFGDLGHPRASNKTGETEHVLARIQTWLDFHLMGDGAQPTHDVVAAITRPRDRPFDPADVITVPDWAALADATVDAAFEGSAVLVNPVDDPRASFFWDPLVMEGARELEPLPAPPEAATDPASLAVFEIPVSDLATGDLLIAGLPVVRLRATSTGVRVQLNARLYDVAPDGTKRLVTRGTVTIEPAPGVPMDVELPTYGNLWEAGADHVLRLEISNLDSPYIRPSTVPSLTTIEDVTLRVPVRSGG
ncbi:MAG: alpha/beta fold hydrolase, partial [Gemmatimonadetes bacterium]|nr:alpha/beta fold hydrolase [Gemmatimonadota bacterium]